MALVVSLKFLALASLLEISFTLCPVYKACAASIIVGVGLYIEFIQLQAFILGLLYLLQTAFTVSYTHL